MNKIRKGDEVILLAGKDRGKRGKVLAIRKDGRVLVSGLNMVKKHTKANPNLGKPGGIVEQEAALDISNVAIFNAETAKADRVGFGFDEDGKKQRLFKSNRQPIDI